MITDQSSLNMCTFCASCTILWYKNKTRQSMPTGMRLKLMELTLRLTRQEMSLLVGAQTHVWPRDMTMIPFCLARAPLYLETTWTVDLHAMLQFISLSLPILIAMYIVFFSSRTNDNSSSYYICAKCSCNAALNIIIKIII